MLAAGCADPASGSGPDGQLRTATLWTTPAELHAGDELILYGEDFGVPAENVVTFNGNDAVRTFKAGSNDALLILDVPPLSFLGSEEPVTVSVSNPRWFASAQITVKKFQSTIPSGSLGVENSLVITVRSATEPATDYVVLNQRVVPVAP
jgi:hypothetical protein